MQNNLQWLRGPEAEFKEFEWRHWTANNRFQFSPGSTGSSLVPAQLEPPTTSSSLVLAQISKRFLFKSAVQIRVKLNCKYCAPSYYLYC